jgi:hypothetical protein
MVEHWNPQPIGNIAQRTRVNSQVRYVDHAKSWRPTIVRFTYGGLLNWTRVSVHIFAINISTGISS